MAQITIYTDGASRGNPGPGGFGSVLISGNLRKELCAGFKETTNNRMELLAVIIGLETLNGQNHDITVYSDSKYVVDSVEKKWVYNWKKNGFKNRKNVDLWLRFLKVYEKHKVKLVWIKGHNNNPENERCDTLAVNAALGNNLFIDTGYLKEKQTANLF